MYKRKRLIRLITLLVILFALPATQASAALVRCRIDPIFVLSNGDVVTVTVDISTHAANIRNVTYTLHVPAGVTVTEVAHTARGLGIKEIYQVYQDNPARTYTTDTVVATHSASITAVIAYTRLNGVFVKSASGYNGQHLIVTIGRPEFRQAP